MRDKFEIVNRLHVANKKFSTRREEVVFKIQKIPKNEDPLEWIRMGMMEIILYITTSVAPTDKIGFTFSSENFNLKAPGWMSFRDSSKVTLDDVWDVLGSIFQSNTENGLDTNTFKVTATIVKMPQGRGSRQRKYNSYDEECRLRNGIVTISNKDNLCLPRALVVGKAHAKKDRKYKSIRKDTAKIQKQKADKLIRKAEVVIGESGCGVSELWQFQAHLKKYKITVYKYGTKGREIWFKGPDAPLKINLLYFDGHYNVITSLTSAFACSYYCEICYEPYEHKSSHRCTAMCPCCHETPPCHSEEPVNCLDCNRKFRGEICFANHKVSICDTLQRCPHCLKTVKVKTRTQLHICGETFCLICKEFKPAGHFCYMQNDNRKPKLDDQLLIFYDLETRQEKSMPYYEDTKIHKPNLCVMQQRCSVCIDDIEGNSNDSSICQKCGTKQLIIKQNVIENFLKYVLGIRKSHKRITCIAHNSKGFDAQFILNHILQKTDIKPELIMRGSKILMLQVGNVKFIDSLSYFPMALSALPKAFGMTSTIKKGYFPHLFNTEINHNYIGSLPDSKYYSPDDMKPKDRDTFFEWYEEHKNDTFDMQKDIVDYCVSDVDILRRACLQFRSMFLEECGVCPFTEAITLPGACNLMFRRTFLQPNTIGIIPRNGYRLGDNQSKIALQWLIWMEDQLGIRIQHAGHQLETVISGIRVDGFCAETKQIFQFHGCFYHGCASCMITKREDPIHKDATDTLEARFERTVATTERLKSLGYDVIETWECKFQTLLKTTPKMKYLESHPLLTYLRLNPRESFYGGRTENTRLKYEVGLGSKEKIKYVDVCSLYPFVCKRGKFPVGHPTVYVGEEAENLLQEKARLDNNTSPNPSDEENKLFCEGLKKIEGLIKCTVLPPQNLYHPVIPIKMHGKLLFPLCRVCAENQNQEECLHNEQERSFTGTWVIDEVLKGVDMGYTIRKVYEIWKYDVIQMDSQTDGLFTKFIDKFVKIKQEASGWPDNCKAKEEKEHYIEEYKNKEGIELEFEKITKNPGLRSLAKLMLNSFWGKFGQIENQPQTSIVTQPYEFFNLLTNPIIDVNYTTEINEDTIIVNWQFKNEAANPLPTANVVIAAYVTAQARLKLYGYLEKLERRVLYYDTDSVIYISRVGEYELPTGNFLGDLTDQLEEYGRGSYITRFASGGPKVYGYEVYSPETAKTHVVFKAKGISLNYETLEKINFNSLTRMIEDPEMAAPILVTSRNVRRTLEHNVVTKEEKKTFRPNSKKRKLIQDFDSVPFGYKYLKTEG